ncbi:MAG: hypothetical protein E7160_03665 [Firmicutes bacterium]|nr:hypothetical protein [Bacillota bacterium]
MENKDLKKLLKYRPPLAVSLLIILGFFLMFIYISKDRSSYAISYEDNNFNDSFETKVVTFGISSDKNIKVSRVYDDSARQVFSLDTKDYGSSYVKDKEITDKGLLYILSNSYPNIDIKDKNGNSLNIDFQTWISQVAIWSYLNEKGFKLDNNLLEAIKTSKKLYSDDQSLSSNKTIYDKYIKNIVNNALNIKLDELNINVFTDDDVYMTKDNKYYQSSLITVSSNDSERFKGYLVNLDNAPKGSFIVDESGKKIDLSKQLRVTDKFYLRIPKNKLSSDNREVRLDVVGVYDEIEAYSYKSDGYSTIIASRKIDNKINKSLYIKF